MLWDAVVVPGGDGVAALASDGRALEFVKDQFRHCKTMLAIGTGRQLLDAAGIPATLADGGPVPGILAVDGEKVDIEAFVAALARHRHFERETDPPRV